MRCAAVYEWLVVVQFALSSRAVLFWRRGTMLAFFARQKSHAWRASSWANCNPTGWFPFLTPFSTAFILDSYFLRAGFRACFRGASRQGVAREVPDVH